MKNDGSQSVPIGTVKKQGLDNWEYGDAQKRKDGNPNKAIENANGNQK